MQYKILSHSNNDKLSKEVNEYLSKGWELYGPMNATGQESWGHFEKMGEYVEYSQAIIKKD